VLLLVDLGAFWVARATYRWVRDAAPFGEPFANFVQVYLPRGFLAGWQFAAALVLGLVVTGAYGAGKARRSASRLLAACAAASALVLWYPLWAEHPGIVLLRFFATTGFVALSLIMIRFALDAVVRSLRDPTPVRTLVIGPEEHDRAPLPLRTDDGDLQVVARMSLNGSSPEPTSAEDLYQALGSQRVDAVLVTSRLTDAQFGVVAHAAATAGCQLFEEPVGLGMSAAWPQVIWRNGRALIRHSPPGLRYADHFAKRLIDLVASTVGMVLLSPVLTAIAVAVRLDSPGPVFFRQHRIGRGGHRFRVWKFRTMKHGASEEAHRELITKMLNGDEATTAHASRDGARIFKLLDDDRITRVGRILRKYSLDELPQLVNVLSGEMSLVGPRPPLAYEVEQYDLWQYDRLAVRPGITGLWQVSGRNLLSYRQMAELDVTYVRNWSLWLDLWILLRTIPVVVFNSGRAS